MPHQETRESVKAKHLPEHNAQGAGGACLSRCSEGNGFKENHSCSYRWQAYLRASKDDPHLYNSPKYDDLVGKEPIRTSAAQRDNHPVPRWYRLTLDAPKTNGWDVGVGNNFKEKCTVPYWHNAHHLIPNSKFNRAIDDAAEGMEQEAQARLLIRAGLLDAKYNLNSRGNMMILPMDEAIGRVLELPIHLRDPIDKWYECHGAYSSNVKLQLDTIFRSVKRMLDNCESESNVDFNPIRQRLEELSARLRAVVERAGTAGVPNLDSIPQADFQPLAPQPKNLPK